MATVANAEEVPEGRQNSGDAASGVAPADADETVIAGVDAVLATVDHLYAILRSNERLDHLFVGVDFLALAEELQRFLVVAFEGGEWPALRVSWRLVEGCTEDLVDVLLEVTDLVGDAQADDARRISGEQGSDVLVRSIKLLAGKLRSDQRVQRFYGHIRSLAVPAVVVEKETPDDVAAAPEARSLDGAADESDTKDQHRPRHRPSVAVVPTSLEAWDSEEPGSPESPVIDRGGRRMRRWTAPMTREEVSAGMVVDSLDELHLTDDVKEATKAAWGLLVRAVASWQAVGEAIFQALFDAAPSMQSLFTTPRAVHANRFTNTLNNCVMFLDDSTGLQQVVEALGFQHMHLDITVARAEIFRDAVLTVFAAELDISFSSTMREGWTRFLNYIGGAIIYVRTHFAERIKILLQSWKLCNGAKDALRRQFSEDSSENEGSERESENAMTDKDSPGANAAKKGGRLRRVLDKFKRRQVEEDVGVGNGHDHVSSSFTQYVPTTYREMFQFNASVMGLSDRAWLNEVLACFDNIVTNVADPRRLQEECDILTLRIGKVMNGDVTVIKFGEYKSCMTASLRSLLPKDWTPEHEVAWAWLWENVERMVLKNLSSPPIWQKALAKLFNSFDDELKHDLRTEIYALFFKKVPAGQDYFKQSNTYLHFIADRILEMTLFFFRDPQAMVDDISALGLRHVGYGIPTELLGPFASVCIEVIGYVAKDSMAVEAFRWSLGLIVKILSRTIAEGSTIVMMAINGNSAKQLVEALRCAPRGERNAWMLIVQVGTQSISPLFWAIESSSLVAAAAIIKDLLTIRADRDRYYYGMEEMFVRHPDIVKKLCSEAPTLLPTLLDGLVWRSTVVENGFRRVNYFVKHMLVDLEGKCAQTLEWIADLRDPKLGTHPVLVFLSDTLWRSVVYRTFLYGKTWFFFTLLLFVASQSVLTQVEFGGDGQTERTLVMVFRTFIYLCSMTQLIYFHVGQIYLAIKGSMTTKVLCIRMPNYLLEDWQDSASLLLTISVVVMLMLEPILWCWNNNEGLMFNERCEKAQSIIWAYTIFSMAATYFYFALLRDMAVFSQRLSAFVLVCGRLLSEVALFVMALAGVILAFSSAMSALRHETEEFSGLHVGSLTLLEMFLRMWGSDRYGEFRDQPQIITGICLFMLLAVIGLTNLLIAQLKCSYKDSYEHMVGYARLSRIEIIIETLVSVPAKRWEKFVMSSGFDDRLEFNSGDVGCSGGLQVREPSWANPTMHDVILRYGGTTSETMPWPQGAARENKLERIEKIMQGALRRLTKKTASGDHGGSSSDSGRRSKSDPHGDDSVG